MPLIAEADECRAKVQLRRSRVQRCKGEREIHFQVSGLGRREPGTGHQVRVRVRVRVLNLYLNLNT